MEAVIQQLQNQWDRNLDSTTLHTNNINKPSQDYLLRF